MIIKGRNACTEALKNDKFAISKVYLLDGGKGFDEALQLCKKRRANYSFVTKDALNRLAEGDNHQGIVLQATEFVYANLNDVLNDLKKQEQKVFFIICSEISDPHNLGAIIRSADFAGANAVIISKNNSCPVNETVFKTSAGACFNLPIIQVSNIAQTIETIKKQNVFVFACEVGGTDYTKIDFKGDTAIVVGGEDEGVKPLVKKLCDEVVSIKNNGKVSSLNASVAAAVVMFEAARQRG